MPRGLWSGLALVSLGCSPSVAEPLPWDEDRVGFFERLGTFGTVALPEGTRETWPEIASSANPSWRWTLRGASIAHQYTNGFGGFDLELGAAQGQFIASSHCAPPSVMDVDTSTSRVAVVEMDCAEPGQFVSIFDFEAERSSPWSRTGFFESPGSIAAIRWAVDSPSLAVVHEPEPGTLEVLRLDVDAAPTVLLPAMPALVRLPRLAANGVLAVAVGATLRIDGLELDIDAVEMDWRPGTDELWVLDADRTLWEATAQGDTRTVYASTGEAGWVGWSHDGAHWAMTEACEEDGSRLVVDGETLGDCVVIDRARWSNRQAVLAYETSAEQGGPAVRVVDLEGRALMVGDARSPRFSP
ncbi:MAG: hypothetical protein ACRBN8_45595 [Nannocystales bacterium]